MKVNHIKVEKVKGHAGDRYNERCDELSPERQLKNTKKNS